MDMRARDHHQPGRIVAEDTPENLTNQIRESETVADSHAVLRPGQSPMRCGVCPRCRASVWLPTRGRACTVVDTELGSDMRAGPGRVSWWARAGACWSCGRSR